MVKAYVLIEMAAGRSANLVRALRENSNILDVTRVTGPYDVIAVIQGDDLQSVHDFVTDHIHHLEGVLRTTTSVSVEQ